MASEGLAGPAPAPGARSDWRIADQDYRHWIDTTEAVARQHLATSTASARARAAGPLISVLVPVFDTPEPVLRQALDSVCGQSYDRWELCLVDDASTAAHVPAVLAEYAGRESRIRLRQREHNGGIAAASNDALALATGQYIALLDHDDLLAPHALLQVAQATLEYPRAGLFYSDSDELDARGRRCNPFFKPDWNYELLLGQNYFNHLSVYSAALLQRLGGFRPGFDGSQDYDLALRAIEQLAGEEIRHIPHVLYHWRVVPDSVARADLGRACALARQAVTEHLARIGQAGEVQPAAGALIFNRVLRPLPEPPPGITVVVYDNDAQRVGASAQQLRASARYPALQIEEVVFPAGVGAGSAALNERCRSIATPLICFLHAAASIGHADFFTILAAHLLRPQVSAVGAKMLSPDNHQCCGPLLRGVGTHGVEIAFGGAYADSKGYFARLCLEHRASAVHGAALAVRAGSFHAVAGFSPGLGHPLLLGADLCFKLAARGEAVIWTPQALVHCPPQLLAGVDGSAPAELEHFGDLWRGQLGLDPFYNPNLNARDGCFRLGAPSPSSPASAGTASGHPHQ